MSDEPKINWLPDENGVPLCAAQIGKVCPYGRAYPDKCNSGGEDGIGYDGCYPQMVKRAAAAKAALEWYDAAINNISKGTLSDAMNRLREAMTP